MTARGLPPGRFCCDGAVRTLTIKRRRGTLKQVRRGAQNKTAQGFGCPAAPRICSGGILSPARGERMRGLERITAQKGTKDVLPAESYRWQHLEGALRDTVASFGYKEIRLPTFEATELFTRGVGETTDVVGKEMYTFNDKGGRSITLRPEGTANTVRAILEHGLLGEALPCVPIICRAAFGMRSRSPAVCGSSISSASRCRRGGSRGGCAGHRDRCGLHPQSWSEKSSAAAELHRLPTLDRVLSRRAARLFPGSYRGAVRHLPRPA